MNTAVRHILLWALLALCGLAGEALAAPALVDQQPSEFCGTVESAPAVVCPQTKAITCYCSFKSKDLQVESQTISPLPEILRKPVVRRKRTTPKILPEFDWQFTPVTYQDKVPTPPPRA